MPRPVRDLRKHEVARQRIVDDVISGLGPGDPLPSERELAENLGVSRMTLRRAIGALVEEGRVTSRQGHGTFVASSPIVKTPSLTSFSQDMISRGLSPSTKVLHTSEVPLSDFTESNFCFRGSNPHDTAWRIVRLRLANNIPMCLETVHLLTAMFPGLTEEPLETSLYEIMALRYGVRVMSADQWVSSLALTPNQAKSLQRPAGDPALKVRRMSSDRRGSIIELTESIYRGDRYEFASTARRRDSH